MCKTTCMSPKAENKKKKDIKRNFFLITFIVVFIWYSSSTYKTRVVLCRQLDCTWNEVQEETALSSLSWLNRHNVFQKEKKKQDSSTLKLHFPLHLLYIELTVSHLVCNI